MIKATLISYGMKFESPVIDSFAKRVIKEIGHIPDDNTIVVGLNPKTGEVAEKIIITEEEDNKK